MHVREVVPSSFPQCSGWADLGKRQTHRLADKDLAGPLGAAANPMPMREQDEHAHQAISLQISACE